MALIFARLNHNFKVFIDSDWAENHDDRTSTLAYIIYFGDTPIAWSFRKQKTIARSLIEAEYRAIVIVVAEPCWVNNLLEDYTFNSLYNNLSCAATSAPRIPVKNSMFHSMMKHLALDFFLCSRKS